MKETRNWIIINTIKRQALCGVKSKALRFSTEEIAREVAEQLFEDRSEILIVNILTDLKL